MTIGTGSVRQPAIGRQLADAASSYVRDRITSGDLLPGSPVRPEEIALELGISSTPAREALHTLRAEGFLRLAPRRGFTVAPITADDIRDMFLVQSLVAGEMAARATLTASPLLDDQLSGIHTALMSAVEVSNLDQLEELNHQFHRAINLAANSPRLALVIQLSSRYAPRWFYSSIPGWPETTATDHTLVLKAILNRDPDAARSAMANHILLAGEQLARHIASRTPNGD